MTLFIFDSILNRFIKKLIANEQQLFLRNKHQQYLLTFQRYIRICAILSSFLISVQAQQYPYWFIYQDHVKCTSQIATSINDPTYYPASAINSAFQSGCQDLARYSRIKISGEQTFWITEIGAYLMDARYYQEYDSSSIEYYLSKFKVVDSYTDKQKVLVLIADSSIDLINDEFRTILNIQTLNKPDWIESLPSDNQFYYSVGESEEYSYESSSWKKAEQNALLSLAKSINAIIRSLQKRNSSEYQDILNEKIHVIIKNARIVARWRDVKDKVFYVLIKSDKH